MNIYIGNLSYEVTEEDLKNAFAPFGRVNTAKVISDMYTGQSKGFGFVEMESRTSGEKAIAELNSIELKGRQIVVNEARPKENRSGGGGGGGGYRGGNGGGGGGGGRGKPRSGGGGGGGGYRGGDRDNKGGGRGRGW